MTMMGDPVRTAIQSLDRFAAPDDGVDFPGLEDEDDDEADDSADDAPRTPTSTPRGGQQLPPPPPPPPPPFNWSNVALVLGAVLLFLGAVAVWMSRRPAAESDK